MLLKRISLRFPGLHPEFHDRLVSLLARIGTAGTGALDVSGSDSRYYPRVSIDFQSADTNVTADFHLSGDDSLSVRIENTTGKDKRNPHPYTPLALDAVAQRLSDAGWKITGADHIGFNLPWFAPGIHPRILELRERLSAACLYHEYPTGEPWDFILPGDADEIAGRKPVAYSATRRPKFELVSFGGASTPLIQIDLGLDARFEDLSARFPEAMLNPAFRNIWIYLDNPYPLDVCLVFNEHAEGDWSDLFTGHRLSAAGLKPL
jgi:hypothetical protein